MVFQLSPPCVIEDNDDSHSSDPALGYQTAFDANSNFESASELPPAPALPPVPGVGNISIPKNTVTSNRYGLLSSVRWTFGTGAKVLSYSFPTSKAQYSYPSSLAEPNSFVAMTSGQAWVIRTVLATYAASSGLTFQEATGTDASSATLRFARVSYTNKTAWAYSPSWSETGGDVWFSNVGTSTPVLGNYHFHTALHELGHALGLKHPHDTSASNSITVQAAYDCMEYSVMSYHSYAGSSLGGYTNEQYGYAQSLMMLDIQAIQFLYGANFGTNSENTIYKFDPNTGEMFVNGVGQGKPGANRIFRTIWDGGGTDTYDLSNYTTGLSINLAPGARSRFSNAQLALLKAYNVSSSGAQPIYASGNLYNALLYNGDLRSLIENAIGGSGNDKIAGNQAHNMLAGGGGNDILNGFDGNDSLSGDAGDDVLTGGTGNDSLDGGTGTNTACYYGLRSDYVLTYNKTSLLWTISDRRSKTGRVTSNYDGVDILENINYVRFFKSNVYALLTSSGTVVTLRSKSVLDADLISDIVLRNKNTGEITIRAMNADGTTKSVRSLGFVTSDWQIASIGDFNNDSLGDILWRNTISGEVGQWVLGANGSRIWRSRGLVANDWQIADTGDFNNDGRVDILWRNTTTGEVGQWLMNLDGSIADWKSQGIVESDWKILASDHFNNDGVSDILWRNVTSGEVGEWIMSSGVQMKSWHSQGFVTPDWQFIDTADFNLDGIADILWRNSATGEIGQWIMAANGSTTWHTQGNVHLSWKVAGAGDYNGDGIADILWRNSSSGEIRQWIMNQDGTIATKLSQGVTTTDWQIVNA